MARELAQIAGNDGQTYEIRDKKFADAGTATTVGDSDYILLQNSDGSFSKITKSNFNK